MTKKQSACDLVFGSSAAAKVLNALGSKLPDGRTVPLSKTFIADRSGVARTTVDEIVPRFVKAGILEPVDIGGYTFYEPIVDAIEPFITFLDGLEA